VVCSRNWQLKAFAGLSQCSHNRPLLNGSVSDRCSPRRRAGLKMFRTENVRALIWTGSTSRADDFHLARVMSGEVPPRRIPTIASPTGERSSAHGPQSTNSLDSVSSPTTFATDPSVPTSVNGASPSVVTGRTGLEYPTVGSQTSRTVRCECDEQVHIRGSHPFASHDVGGRLEHGQP
jgi:hypothetical protein